ncbi:unnamed protein product [Lampetra fluviatilis]
MLCRRAVLPLSAVAGDDAAPSRVFPSVPRLTRVCARAFALIGENHGLYSAQRKNPKGSLGKDLRARDCTEGREADREEDQLGWSQLAG